MSFCRAVEATSVTPFAPRALDAMLAAAARHVEPALTPEAAAGTIAENPQAYAEVRFVVAAKMQVAGHDIQVIDRCLARLDAVRDAWADIADKQKRSGDDFAYAKEDPGRRLLQDPFSRRANN